jgi:hypothetical protein
MPSSLACLLPTKEKEKKTLRKIFAPKSNPEAVLGYLKME